MTIYRDGTFTLRPSGEVTTSAHGRLFREGVTPDTDLWWADARLFIVHVWWSAVRDGGQYQMAKEGHAPDRAEFRRIAASWAGLKPQQDPGGAS